VARKIPGHLYFASAEKTLPQRPHVYTPPKRPQLKGLSHATPLHNLDLLQLFIKFFFASLKQQDYNVTDLKLKKDIAEFFVISKREEEHLKNTSLKKHHQRNIR